MTSSIETESIETTDLVIDRATGSVETEFPFAGLMAVIRSSLGDTIAEAREAFGEDSVTESSFTVTNNNLGYSETFEGDLIVGASHTRSQTMAFPQTVAMLLSSCLLGMFRGTVSDAIMDAIRSGYDGVPNDEVAAAIMDAINLSPEALAAGQEVLAEMRRVSTRTVSAPVRFD